MKQIGYWDVGDDDYIVPGRVWSPAPALFPSEEFLGIYRFIVSGDGEMDMVTQRRLQQSGRTHCADLLAQGHLVTGGHRHIFPKACVAGDIAISIPLWVRQSRVVGL